MNWEITDSIGTIMSGTEEQMIEIWDNTVNTGKSPRIDQWTGHFRNYVLPWI